MDNTVAQVIVQIYNIKKLRKEGEKNPNQTEHQNNQTVLKGHDKWKISKPKGTGTHQPLHPT